MAGRRWLINAFFIFMLLLFGWVVAAFLLNPASANTLPSSLNMGSRLGADYRPGEITGSIARLRLKIIGDALRDAGLSAEEAEEQSHAFNLALQTPVPTSTAINFEGDVPSSATTMATQNLTSTPTSTGTPTITPTPT